MSLHKEYMKNLQNKIDHMNNINPKTYDFSNRGCRETFYNSSEDNKVGNKPNISIDYKSFTIREQYQKNTIKKSNNFLSKN